MTPMRDEAPRPLPVRPALPPEPRSLLSSWSVSQRNLLELIPERALHEPILSSDGGPRWHMVMAPEAIRRILQTRVEDYPKSGLARSVLRPAIGDSMLVAEGESWRRQRRAAAPAFQPRHVSGLGPVMTGAAERAAARLEDQVGRAADLLEEMVAATFEVIADTTFSGEAGVDRDSVLRALEAYGMAAGRMSFLDVLGAPEWVPRPARLRPAPEMTAMQELADATIAARRDRPAKDAPDLLDLLLRAEGAGLQGTDVRDNLLAFIVAGHETTALTLAWAFYLLALDEAAQDRLRAEARAVLGPRAATAADVPDLPYTRRVIDEALRLYPAAGFLSRMATEHDEILGRTILPGDTVTIPVYAVHRHRALWRDPDAFDPDRFADAKAIPRYGYLPFGDGPRVCIGARFALQEAVTILATLVARFRFAAIPGKVPAPTLIITLRPEGGVWLEVARAG
jgi:cytochrome P450